jgi:hypothetical protein
VQNPIGVEAFKLSFRFEHDAVTQYRQYGALYVVGNKVVAILERGKGLGDTHKTDGCAWACTESQHGPLTGAANEFEHVVVKFWFDANGVNLVARGSQ